MSERSIEGRVGAIELGKGAGMKLFETSYEAAQLHLRLLVGWFIIERGPPDEFGSPYRATSAFAASPALLAEPQAPVSEREIESFVERHPYWAGEWGRFAGQGAIADQVRFEREWTTLREYLDLLPRGYAWWLKRREDTRRVTAESDKKNA